MQRGADRGGGMGPGASGPLEALPSSNSIKTSLSRRTQSGARAGSFRETPVLQRSEAFRDSVEVDRKSGGLITSIERHPVYEKCTLLLILANAAWIGVDLDWNTDALGERMIPKPVFSVMDHLFAVGFTLEILIRIFGYGERGHVWSFFTDKNMWKWNNFDLTLVMLMVMETWVLTSVPMQLDLGSLTMLRMLRLLRISRVFRMVPELGLMVKAMGAAARSVSSTLVLEIGLMYVFAVLLTQWATTYQDPCFEILDDGSCMVTVYFGTISRSLVSLLQILVFDDTFSIIRPLLREQWHIGCLLIVFICIGAFTMLNMLIGIICEIVSTTTTEEKRKVLRSRIQDIFSAMDQDSSGTVSREEYGNNAAHDRLLKLGIQGELIEGAFDILDVDGGGTIGLDEFLMMIFKLLDPPQSQDILMIHQKIIKMEMHMTRQMVADVKANISDTIIASITTLDGELDQRWAELRVQASLGPVGGDGAGACPKAPRPPERGPSKPEPVDVWPSPERTAFRSAIAGPNGRAYTEVNTAHDREALRIRQELGALLGRASRIDEALVALAALRGTDWCVSAPGCMPEDDALEFECGGNDDFLLTVLDLDIDVDAQAGARTLRLLQRLERLQSLQPHSFVEPGRMLTV